MNQHTNVKFQVAKNYDEMSLDAAAFLHAAILQKPGLLLCPASGNSPRQTYDLLAARLDSHATSALKVIALDEWVGLSSDDPASGGYQIKSQLIGPLGLKNFFLFRGDAPDAAAEALRAEQYLHQNGPIDLCILGIGANGHLGLNEPADSLSGPAHRSQLAASTQAHQMVAHTEHKPEYGITLGMRDIMLSKKIVLLVNGAHKSAVMADFLTGRISTRLPASFLWLHPDVTCFCDREAVGFEPLSDF